MEKVAFNKNVLDFLRDVVSAINENDQAGAQRKLEQALHRMKDHARDPGADTGAGMAAPKLHGIKNLTVYKAPNGGPNLSDSLTKFAINLSAFLKAAASQQGAGSMIATLVDDYGFIGDLKDLVQKVAFASDQETNDPTGKFGADVMAALRKVNDHLGKLATAGHIKFASDYEGLDDSAIDVQPESLPEASEPPAGKPAAHEPPAGGAEGMMCSIDSLVTSIDAFLDNLPVTAFHDRDAEKAARARAKATELRDDVLIIRKQVSDTRAAINGDPGHTERFASLARNVALKFATSAAGK